MPKPDRKPCRSRMYRNPILLAREWQKSLEVGIYASKADLARRKGISRARVTQILNLLRLSRDVTARIVALGDPVASRLIAERWLRPLVDLPPDQQRYAINKILSGSH